MAVRIALDSRHICVCVCCGGFVWGMRIRIISASRKNKVALLSEELS